MGGGGKQKRPRVGENSARRSAEFLRAPLREQRVEDPDGEIIRDVEKRGSTDREKEREREREREREESENRVSAFRAEFREKISARARQ